MLLILIAVLSSVLHNIMAVTIGRSIIAEGSFG